MVTNKTKSWSYLVSKNKNVFIQDGNTVSVQMVTSSYEPEELHISKVLGEVGTASVPLGLIIACARFNSKQAEINIVSLVKQMSFPLGERS